MNFTIAYRARRIFRGYEDWLRPGQAVLDVGCGNGVVGAMLADQFQCKVTGTDILNYVKTGLPFVQLTDGGDLPFEADSFDTVMLNDMLHHVPWDGQEHLLREALRVGRQVQVFEVEPSAYVSFTDWLPNKVHNPLMRISLSHRSAKGWQEVFERVGATQVDARRIKDPVFDGLSNGEVVARFFYKPVINWAFRIQR
jgi:ubiquinone/menaquinone biosynthesis C-methylase UbiE